MEMPEHLHRRRKAKAAVEAETKAQLASLKKELLNRTRIQLELKEFLTDFLKGTSLLLTGCTTALTDSEVKTLHMKLVKPFALSLVISFIVVKVVFIPVLLIMYLISLATELAPETWDMAHQMSNSLVFAVPFIVMTFMRYVWFEPFEKVFFSCLRAVDRELADTLNSYEPWSTKDEMIMLGKKMYYYVKLAGLYFILSHIPIVNILALPLSEYYVMHRKFGVKVAILYLAAFGFGFGIYAQILQSYWLGSRILVSELIGYTYLHRVRLSHQDNSRLIKKFDPVLIGFGLPLYCAFAIPYAGGFSVYVRNSLCSCVLDVG
eukprot:CFRG5009T1